MCPPPVPSRSDDPHQLGTDIVELANQIFAMIERDRDLEKQATLDQYATELSPRVVELVDRAKENGFWNPHLEGLYRHRKGRFVNVAALQVMTERLASLGRMVLTGAQVPDDPGPEYRPPSGP